MGKEKLAEYLEHLFSHKNKPHEADKTIVHKPDYSPVSPWKIALGESKEDRELTSMMAGSFNPRFPGTSDLFPIADLDGRWLARPRANDAGIQVSSIWLDPEIWQPTLNEFAHFADYFNIHISFLVNWDNLETHSAFTQKGYISVTPVLVDGQGFGKSGDIMYGITDEGKVNIGTIKTGFTNLGHLNPRRENAAAASRLIEMLSQK